MRIRSIFLSTCLVFFGITLPTSLTSEEKVKPIRALMITGGCCHDYEGQKNVLSEGISERVDVKWKIVHQGGKTTNTKIPFYENPDWAKGFDVVVHNECFAHVTDPKWTEKILKPHREGLPAVVIHCAMHSYRDKTDEWFKFVGVTSHGHGPHYAFDVINLKKDHPIMSDFGKSWKTPQGELYHIAKVWPNTKPLAHAPRRGSDKKDVCVWTNSYGKGRVFGTTIGHYKSTMSHPHYLDMVTRGLVWAVDGPEIRKIKKVKAPLVPVNLALGKPAKASAEQDGSKVASRAVDGDLSSRWCANNDAFGHWWQVDLQKAEEVTGLRIVWEFERKYKYYVEASLDGKSWTRLTDHTKKKKKTRGDTHQFKTQKIRHLKLSIEEQEAGAWASIWEFEVHGTKLEDATKVQEKKKKQALQAYQRDVKAPEGFDVSIYAVPPEVTFPAGLAAAPNGDVFIAVDKNSSISRDPNRGSIVRCRDKDQDGTADEITTYVKNIDSPRGMSYADGCLYVVHPPFLTKFEDQNDDGVSDKQTTLVEGLGFDLSFRGADHTSNGVRLGIDGWLYLAIGDYGMVDAKARDGSRLKLLGGGIVRVRTDGSDLELFADGLRNVYDIAVGPELNAFTRDNTNDGGGWDIRVTHITATSKYGYPTLFKNFSSEIAPPLAVYGGGSGTGALTVSEPFFFDAPYDHMVLTVDWGRSRIYLHPQLKKGATFHPTQEEFLTIPRPTDLDADARGNIYVASWKGGMYTYTDKPVGFVVRLSQKNKRKAKYVELQKAPSSQLITALMMPSHVYRLNASQALIRRGYSDEAWSGLKGILTAKVSKAKKQNEFKASGPSHLAQVAALYTLQQLDSKKAQPILIELAQSHASLREHALRALADDLDHNKYAPLSLFLRSLKDSNLRVVHQAIVGLGRIGNKEAAEKVLPFTTHEDPVVSHSAVQSLIAMKAYEACLKVAFNTESKDLRAGCFKALNWLHSEETVDGLIRGFEGSTEEDRKIAFLTCLIRLYHTEKPWDGKGWWGTRPDTRGPYYRLIPWEQTDRIKTYLEQIVTSPKFSNLTPELLRQLRRHRVNLPAANKRLLELAKKETQLRQAAVELAKDMREVPLEYLELLKEVALSMESSGQMKNMAIEALKKIKGGKGLMACVLALSDKKDFANKERTWVQFVRDRRHAWTLDFFLKLTEADEVEQREIAYGTILNLASSRRLKGEMKQKLLGAIESAWQSPDQAEALLLAIGKMRWKSRAKDVEHHLTSTLPNVQKAAGYAAERIGLKLTPGKKATIEKMTFSELVKKVSKAKGDVNLGKKLFTLQGCNKCHTVSTKDKPVGPFLGGISKRYNRLELTKSIVQPSATIAQGFTTNWFLTNKGLRVQGFISRESGDEVEYRDTEGNLHNLKKKDIITRGTTTDSMMPVGLVSSLSLEEMVSLLTYLESLKAE